jgi:hypothetical protein
MLCARSSGTATEGRTQAAFFVFGLREQSNIYVSVTQGTYSSQATHSRQASDSSSKRRTQPRGTSWRGLLALKAPGAET